MSGTWQRQHRDKLRRLNAQLCENTGTHMLDSGGSNGRMWQRNAIIPPIAESYQWVRFDVYGGALDANRTRNTLYVLDDWLCDTESATWARRSFAQFCRREDQQSNPWYETLSDWAERVGARIGDGENTYNFDNNLSQGFQWNEVELPNGDTIIALQTHNGADIRGGYSAPTFWGMQDTYPDCFDSEEVYIGEGGYGVSKYLDIPAVRWDELELPDSAAVDDLLADMCKIVAKGRIDFAGEYILPRGVLEDIWDECSLDERWARLRDWEPRAFVIVKDPGNAVGVVRTPREGNIIQGEVWV